MHPRRYRIFFSILLAAGSLIALFSACTLQGGGSPQLDRSANFTQAALTLDAQLTLAAQGAFPTVTPLKTSTGTSIPVITQTNPGDPGPAGTPDPSSPCDRGAFVSDVSVPDGTVFEPGTAFVKTWRLRNNGSCTWTTGYQVVFDSGDAMGGPASFPLTSTNIPPGSEVEVSINLTAPDEPGSYRGDWRLRNPAGQVFGLGSGGDAAFWVIVAVQEKPKATIVFDNAHVCGQTANAIFRISNTGDANFESARITFENLTTGQTIFGPFDSNGPFMGGSSECPPGGSAVVAGSSAFLGGPLAGNTVTGHTIEASFTICSQDNLAGACIDLIVEFEVP